MQIQLYHDIPRDLPSTPWIAILEAAGALSSQTAVDTAIDLSIYPPSLFTYFIRISLDVSVCNRCLCALTSPAGGSSSCGRLKSV